MTIHTIICTRNRNHKRTLEDLLTFLGSIHIQYDSPSIWEGYSKGFNEILKYSDDNDIVIFCHDDIEILTKFEDMENILEANLLPNTGFVGVAGASSLKPDSVWWQSEEKKGIVFHGGKLIKGDEGHATVFGPYGNVQVMDGVFLAARVSTLRTLDCLQKPKYLTGDWNFYDLHMTMHSWALGYKNKVVPIMIRHESAGEIVGRPEWHKSREEFSKKWFGAVILS